MIVNQAPQLPPDFVPKVLIPLLETESASPSRRWTLQGFGMLRLHFPQAEVAQWPLRGLDTSDVRLNLWHTAFTVPNVSTIHTHPWHFTSYILSGDIFNTVYREAKSPGFALSSPYLRYPIIPGPNGGLSPDTPPTLIHLYTSQQAVLRPGDSYTQTADEIHETDFLTGTVTLNFRTRPPGLPDKALVFVPEGLSWVSAIPRQATPDEIQIICAATLARLKSERLIPCPV